MGQGALRVFVLSCLLAFIRTEEHASPCWVKGTEMTAGPFQCPAAFEGMDAKVCCRACYGPNCCFPRKPRVNLGKCPHIARMDVVTPDDIDISPAGTDIPPTGTDITPTGTDISPNTTATSEDHGGLAFLAIGGVIILLSIIAILIHCGPFECLWGWREAELLTIGPGGPPVVTRLNARRRRTSTQPPPPYSFFERSSPPPPYSLEDALGNLDLPPPYPGEPVVKYRRPGSQMQEDEVVIVYPPNASASSGDLEPAAAAPLDVSASGDTLEPAALPNASASGSTLEPELMVPPDASTSGGPLEPGAMALPDVSASEGTLEPVATALLDASASGGATEPAALPDLVSPPCSEG